MATFQITSKLSSSERSRVNRAAERFSEQGDANTTPGAFVKSGVNTYTNLHDGADIHAAARHAMVIAGRMFDYTVN